MAFTGINKSTDYFNNKKYSGTGSTQSITGVGFQPDWSWIKNASSGSNYSHTLTDAARGVTKKIATNNTNAEYTSTTELTSFDSDGFTVGADVGVNSNGSTLISWNWKANGQGSSDTNGTINSTYTSANTTSGFSIITYTGDGNSGATIGHGLGVVPKIVLIKKLNGADAWFMTGENLGWNKYVNLNSSSAESGASNNSFTGTAPTTTVFSVGSDSGVNGNGDTYVAYVFAEKQGFCKIGTYVGNGSTNGPFHYTGFKPAWLLTKKLTGATESDAESASQTDRLVDFVSNGVKIRGNSAQMNGSGNTFIYMVFGEAPIVGTNDIPANAK